MNSYVFYNLLPDRETIEDFVRLQAPESFMHMINNERDYMPTRTAYLFDLKGPAINVQTACSTSLVAVSTACTSLLNYQCDIALAGGVTIITPQELGYLYQPQAIGSPDGTCRPFDANAAGTVGSNGAGIVALKRLDEALRDGDAIHAVILGTGVNNDGADKVGYTAPSVDGQADAIAMAHAMADIDASTISYIEAHGTATPIGDPIEIKALSKAFAEADASPQSCALGAVKSNIGHLDTAAGVAGLIKTVLALKHEQIPPSLHFESPNPEIDFANSPFRVNSELSSWPRGDQPRRAGVSSFGLGGTNAHVVVEEAPALPPSGDSRSYQLLLLSAHTETALEAMTSRLVAHLAKESDMPDSLADIAYTLHVGRERFSHRRMVVARNRTQARSALETLDPGLVFTRAQDPVSRPITFLFPGQGAQHPGMAAGLYDSEPVFRKHLDHCLHSLANHLDVDLKSLVLTTDERIEDATSKLEQTAVTQPALFAVEYALAQQWMHWGVTPHSMLGHSVGEYVAACLSGVFTLEDALSLIAARGRLMQSLPHGSMLMVPLSERKLTERMPADLSLAAINGPEICVVS
ncbi:MAG: type I polyketide synthase, partial [Myxococcota bacterium]